MKRILALVLATLISLSLFAACGSSPAQEADTNTESTAQATDGETTFGLTPLAERTTLSVGFFAGSAHGMPFYIADQEGFFDELNIDVEYQSFVNGPAMMEANASWDIATVGAPGVLNGMKNYDVRMVSWSDDEVNTGLFTRADSEIAADPTNPEVWKGKEIILATGTTLQYVLATYLESIGASVDDVTIINMDVTSGLTAFRAGEGDVVAAWNAVAYTAEDEGFVRITDMGELGIKNISGLAATEDAITNKTELTELAWLVYYLTWDWVSQSDANMDIAVEHYVISCEDEGVVSSESICRRSLSEGVFNCPTPQVAYSDMMTLEDDISGNGEQVLVAANHLFVTLDFFISLGSYTQDDRAYIIDNNLVDASIAESAGATLTELGLM